MFVTKISLHLEPAAVLFDTLHGEGCRALSKHVLRGDGRDLASFCSYRSLLALLFLPCFSLISADKGNTVFRMCHRVILTRVSSGEWEQVRLSSGIGRTYETVKARAWHKRKTSPKDNILPSLRRYKNRCQEASVSKLFGLCLWILTCTFWRFQSAYFAYVHFREHNMDIWGTNVPHTCTSAPRRLLPPLCWNIDANLQLWRNPSSVTLKVGWWDEYFNDLFAWAQTSGVKFGGLQLYSGNFHWKKVSLHVELPILSSPSAHFFSIKRSFKRRLFESFQKKKKTISRLWIQAYSLRCNIAPTYIIF